MEEDAIRRLGRWLLKLLRTGFGIEEQASKASCGSAGRPESENRPFFRPPARYSLDHPFALRSSLPGDRARENRPPPWHRPSPASLRPQARSIAGPYGTFYGATQTSYERGLIPNSENSLLRWSAPDPWCGMSFIGVQKSAEADDVSERLGVCHGVSDVQRSTVVATI